jgi:hypothetical protein
MSIKMNRWQEELLARAFEHQEPGQASVPPPPTDQPPPGSIITWEMVYGGGPHRYHYAAVRVDGHGWYTTSTRWPSPIGWSDMRRIIGPNPCFVATAWAPVNIQAPV